jgi:hypothetical protein
MPEDKSKYLEFLQAAITRMGSNSFVSKGWSITLATAIFALAAKDANPRFAVVGIIPVVLFWSLDAYYLGLERNFRGLYNAARNLGDDERVMFDLTPAPLTASCWWKMALRPAVILVHAPMLVVVISLTIVGICR